jgi:hypothetical protein
MVHQVLQVKKVNIGINGVDAYTITVVEGSWTIMSFRYLVSPLPILLLKF